MRLFKTLTVSIALAISACGQAAAPSQAEAQTAATGEVTAAERAAILTALGLQANAQGLVQNECGDMVTPQFIVADVGSGRRPLNGFESPVMRFIVIATVTD